MTAAMPCAPERSEISALRRENEQLRQAMDSRAVIDQAKGALMLRYGLDDVAAFALLRRWSQSSNRKVRTIADTLVSVVCADGSRVPPDAGLAHWLEREVLAAPPGTSERTATA
jgi:aryl carrier-like protein